MSSTRFILKDITRENKIFNNRLIVAGIIIFIILSIIVVRLVFLQIINYENYTTLSEKNRIKILPLPPTRGLIYDRNGVLLAANRVSYSLEIIPEKIKNIEKMIEALSKIVTIKETDITRFKKLLKQTHRFKTVPLRYRLTEDEVARFSVQGHRFPGIDIKSNLSRYYPLEATGVHVIGYVGRINERELKIIDKSNYMGGHYIGKTGIEKYYEKELHGITGNQHVETNVQGRIVRVLKRKSPVPGKNLYLNIDIFFQKYIERLISKERAAVVAIEPKSGGILALVSAPSYDPNLFVNGIDVKTYHKLRDSLDRPLFNRAIQGKYPPGSTVKPYVGLAGLEYAVRTRYNRTWCRGWYTLKGQKHRYRDWKRSGHGSMNLHRALEQSCDVYFYALAHDLGIERLHTFLTRFGFGKKTGIDISSELSGLVPSREWKRKKRRKLWYPGETLIVGIGQGFMQATPLQLAVATATLSNRGRFKQPRVVFAIEDAQLNEMTVVKPTQQEMITLKQEVYWDTAINGMKAVVHARRGSAYKVGKDSDYRFAGKTGTAQVVAIKQRETYNADKLDKKFHDHALFVAFAPLKKPRIAVSVIVENGGSGSKMAAPIAKKIMDYYLLPNSPLYLATKTSQ
ncbi:penicillin-binding protein 2 [Candidatus Parabeggiatoa sp. HSG14]|uniref:penicillin-binding protein 2 n=1 Tax=Candidatus Parabeggiatoa sp. HSG14 TaxID=3055593 RepID=UPI0025A856AC|nr:penicillin-binding protein 2 [Thiotrichales bacterium HSG14]